MTPLLSTLCQLAAYGHFVYPQYRLPASWRGVAVALQISLGLYFAAIAFELGMWVWAYQAAARWQRDPDSLAMEDLDTLDVASGSGLLSMVLMICCAILWIIWQFQAHRSDRLRPVDPPLPKSWWSFGGWFIPFASLALPFIALVRIRRAATPPEHRAPSSLLVNTWWSLWILTFILDRVVAAVARAHPLTDASTPRDLGHLTQQLSTAIIICDAVELATTVLAVLVVRDVTRRVLAAPSQWGPQWQSGGGVGFSAPSAPSPYGAPYDAPYQSPHPYGPPPTPPATSG